MNPIEWWTEGGPVVVLITAVGIAACLWAVASTRRRPVRFWFDAALAWVAALCGLGVLGTMVGLIAVFSAVAQAAPVHHQQMLTAGLSIAHYPAWVAIACAVLLCGTLAGVRGVAGPAPSEGREAYGLRAIGAAVLALGTAMPLLGLAAYRTTFTMTAQPAGQADWVAQSLFMSATVAIGTVMGAALYAPLRVFLIRRARANA